METNNESRAKSRTSTFWRWGLLLVLVLIVAGAAFFAYRQNIGLGEAFRAAKTASGEAVTTTNVKAALALSRKVSAFDIDVDTQGGVVRLTGRVPSDEVRKLAIAIASDTVGVERVEDRLMLDESARPDPEISRLQQRVADLEVESAVAAALRRHPELNKYELDVDVADGVVTLSGTVPSPSARYGAETLASDVEGVTGVTNTIEIEGGDEAQSTDRDGRELAEKVEFELFKTEAFNLNQMSVEATAAKVVTLKGMTRSQAERLLAERVAASVEGVERVVNRLEVIDISPEA